MGLFSKLSGKEPKGGDALCFVLGSDKRFFRRMMELQGTHLQDNHNRMAYFASPDSNGVLSKKVRGMERVMGPISVAYEPITELFRFRLLDWPPDRAAIEAGSNGHHETLESDEILDNSWAEGFSLAQSRQEDNEIRNRLMFILLLAVLGTVAMFLLVAASTGQLSGFIEGAGKFFGK
ncbi:hypothetical protein [Candidatus Magnetobacterium casense]|uniref:Uncharacterized protein n=1 Tax=Candidatus Magnetobacterium casense TaxID=1455061 RepID=A0ABS6S1Y3_9BACT|nr:hypothetical protein [Candidatus Magnetobacterium casensis]MBV6342853.1 hypothetical protein [Candidatus Magnetobacterium casensis]